MGNYDVKWHAYEQAMKNDTAWQKLSKEQKAEQFGRYAQGLQTEEIKVANKKNGKEIAKALASERADKIKMYENLFDQADAHYAGRAKYNELSQQLNGNMKVTYGTNPELEQLNDWYRKTEASSKKVAELGKKLDGRMTVSINTDSNAILGGMNDRYRFLEERSNYKRALGEKLRKPTPISADIIDQRLGIGQTSPQTEFYRALEQSQNANKFKLGKWGKFALIGLGVAAGIGLAVWAIKKLTNNKEENNVQEQKQEQLVPIKDSTTETTVVDETPVIIEDTVPPVVVPPATEEQTDPATVTPGTEGTEDTTVVPPATSEDEKTEATKEDEKVDKTEETDKTEKTDKNESVAITVDGKKYTVKKGDNVWNIAKKHLREELGREPKLSEIKAKEQQIMKDNDLKFEADGYVCIIKPDQELKVA